MEERGQTCLVCRAPKARGLALMGAFLCDGCHGEMAALSVDDARYGWYVARLAAWWRSWAAGALPRG